MVDEQRLRQVLTNLLENAIKFTENGTVKLSVINLDQLQLNPAKAKTQKVTLCFQVSDTGIGIEPHKLDQIFLPFEQLDPSVTALMGTGLGLAISHRIVKAMGGTIDVTSQIGQGSTFAFQLTLPTVADDTSTVSVSKIDQYLPMPQNVFSETWYLPDIDSLKEMLLLTQQGLLFELEAETIQLKQAYPESSEFLAVITRLIKRFQFESIESLLQQALNMRNQRG